MSSGSGSASLVVRRRYECGTWLVTETAGAPGAFHARELPSPARREIWVHEPDAAALVLGSTQPAQLADPDALSRRGVALVRRHSGGGAVLVEPGGLTWVDVLLPAGDPLWCVDVGESFVWLGEVWLAALARLGVDAQVHRGALLRRPWWREICFAGLGPGEVVAAGGGAESEKLVGVAQRRRRHAARFQCAALHRWDPHTIVDLLELTHDEREQAITDLRDVAAPVRTEPAALLTSFLAALPP